ncbi:hypothetical protein [Xanthomonas bonasiae]|uniref:hypothetical protein n=1 Tax=Xanthomonas bonasiae TaxID=2810351 RepID=UPI00177F8763|nr:hypothetical protein [Xanthomonas surreyensis]MBD7924029.1 hypothetical protein [Xanthomonas surreyensis]
MNRPFADLRLLHSAQGVAGWLYPPALAAAFACTWLPGKAANILPPILMALLVTFVWMLLGARLLSLLEQGRQLRLPSMAAHFVNLFGAALALTVLLPTLLLAMRDAEPGLSLAVLLLSASFGMLVATLPAWCTPLIGILPGTLGGLLPEASFAPLATHPRASMLLAALACSLTSMWAYRYLRGRPLDALSAWTRPMWIGLQQRQPGDGTTKQAVESQCGRLGWIQGIARPAFPTDLRRQPECAMRYALGPGFAPGNAVGTVLAAVAMPALVLLLWTPLLLRSQSPALPLILSNVMANMSSVKFLQRLWLWRKHGNLGLMESALLPGLGAPGQAGKLFNQIILKRALASVLPWLGLCCLLGAVQHAPPAYYPLVVSISMTASLTASTLLLVCMRWPRGGLVLSVAQFVLTMLGAISIGQVGQPGAVAPHWLASAWSLLLLGMVIAYNLVARQASKRPHPWLLN